MARGPRIHIDDSLHHVMVRGVRGMAVFSTDALKQRFLGLVSESKKRCGALIHAFAVMSNHAHFLIQIGKVALGKIFQQPLSTFGLLYNLELDEMGHVLQGRFKSKLVDNDAYLLNVARYIEHNPIKAGLASSAERYAWSSFRAYLGVDDSLTTKDLLLSLFGGKRPPVESYRRFILAQAEARWPHDEPEWLPEDDEEESLPSIDPRLLRILERAAQESGLPLETVLRLDVRGKASAARALAARRAVATGIRPYEVAGALGCSRAAVFKMLRSAG